jgi:hypothetical protein
MAGKPGRSGTNKGQDKPWRDALMLAVNELDPTDPDKKAKKLRKIAQAVVDAAIAGDMQAAKEIGDRMDGKPRQEIEANVNETVQYVARLPAHVDNPDEWLRQNKTTIQ